MNPNPILHRRQLENGNELTWIEGEGVLYLEFNQSDRCIRIIPELHYKILDVAILQTGYFAVTIENICSGLIVEQYDLNHNLFIYNLDGKFIKSQSVTFDSRLSTSSEGLLVIGENPKEPNKCLVRTLNPLTFDELNRNKIPLLLALEKRKLDTLSSMVNFENSLAQAMLEEILHNSFIKNILGDIAKKLNAIILRVLKLNFAANPVIDKLPPHLKESLLYLINEHSAEFRQANGILVNFYPSIIKSNSFLITRLLDTLEEYLLGIHEAKSMNDVAKVLKSISEISYCFVEHYPAHVKNEMYQLCYSIVYPTQKELMVRIKSEPRLATTFGIRTLPEDFVEVKDTTGRICGKAVYKTVSTVILNLTIASNQKEVGDLKVSDDSKSELIKYKFTEKNKLDELIHKYKMLGDRDKIKLDFYSFSPTMIEKIAFRNKPNPLPLIASVSSTLSRTLITLTHFGVFGPQENFDFSRALIVNNAMVASLVRYGHHSFIEIIEIYNRLLDFIGIAALKNNRVDLASKIDQQYRTQCHYSFFHATYRDSVWSRAGKILSETETSMILMDKRI